MKKPLSCAVLYVLVLFLCFPAVLHGGVLTKNTSVDLPGVYAGSAACGDLNNDGYIDVVIIGEAEINGSFVRIAKIYKNTAGQFPAHSIFKE